VNLGNPTFSLTNNGTYEDPNVNTASGLATVSVTEASSPGAVLTGISCSEVSTGLPAFSDSTVDVTAHTAMIRAEPGEDITCTFTSQLLAPTAAAVSISGRVLSSSGSGVRGARLSLVDLRSGRSLSATSNSFGYYSFSNVQVGNTYTLSASSSGRFTLTYPTRILTPYDAVSDLNFTPDSP